nr:MAG TPA: hypothetical protein [Caudoviricetes sp.]
MVIRGLNALMRVPPTTAPSAANCCARILV